MIDIRQIYNLLGPWCTNIRVFKACACILSNAPSQHYMILDLKYIQNNVDFIKEANISLIGSC
jgi:hypothetical protein